MCGIVAFSTPTQNLSVDALLDALMSLEYRGYDSAGIAFRRDRYIKVERTVGDVAKLKIASKAYLDTRPAIAIAHTRWATHGGVTKENAHPHLSKNKTLAIVHNGIIENFQNLRANLAGYVGSFRSDTDTEVVAHLLEQNLGKTAKGDTEQALDAWHNTLKLLKGSWAFVALSKTPTEALFFAKNQSPLVLGVDTENNRVFLASDTVPLQRYTSKFIFLKDGDFGIITTDDTKPIKRIILIRDGKKVTPEIRTITGRNSQINKGKYEHFMLKEIEEQPQTLKLTYEEHINTKGEPKTHMARALDLISPAIKENKLIMVACGTSYHACLVIQQKYLQKTGKFIPVFKASEFRYSGYQLGENGVAIVVSQSGETADLIGAIKKLKKERAKIVAILNTPMSTIDRLADVSLFTQAGAEIGVASTKAFTTQLLVLDLLLNLHLEDYKHMKVLEELPGYVAEVLKHTAQIKKMAQMVSEFKNVYYLGRQEMYPLAMEGALKLKEIAYIHAEAYTSGEMKHGPIALVDQEFLTIMLTPNGELYTKNLSNMQEIQARGGKILQIVNSHETKRNMQIALGKIPADINFYAFAIPLQLLAYYSAVSKGLNPDRPRNLAKSVTVE